MINYLLKCSGAALLCVLLFTGCQRRNTTMHVVSQPTIQEQELKEVRLKKIFFGHQSVGGNILEGIHSLLAGTTQPALRIVETADPSSFTEPLFAHAKIGTNGDPQSKC